MDRLRQMLGSIAQNLGGLSLNARLLIAAVAVIAVLVLVVVATVTGKATMSELTTTSSPEQTQRAVVALEAAGIKHSVQGNKILVPVEQQYRAAAVLAQGNALPSDTRLLFSNLAKSQHWMNSKTENDRQFNIAQQNELALVVQNFRGVEQATVMIDAPEPVGLGLAYRKPTASVTVKMQPGRTVNAEMVDAIAALVSGSRAGLTLSDVRVIDAGSGRQFKARAEDDFRAGDYLEHVGKVEERVQQKILEALRYIPGVVVAVNAHVDVRRTTTSTTSMLPVSPQGGSVSIVSKERTSSTSTGQGGRSADPGVRSNVQEDINSGGGGSSQVAGEQNETEFKVGLGSKRSEVIDPRGMPTRVNVMVNVPREHVAALIRTKKGDDKAEVKSDELEAAFVAERDRIAKDLQPLVETTVAAVESGAYQTQPGTVAVSLIPVPLAAAGLSAGASASLVGGLGGGGAGGGVLGTLAGTGLVQQALLGLLAVVALGLMFSLVRKASKPVELPTPQEVVGVPPALEAGSDLVGEADETQTAMVGIELPEDALKSKKMLEQVSEMVKKNPAEAANLMNRWLQTEP